MTISRGQPSIGLSNITESAPTLPPVVTDVATHLDYLTNQLADLTQIVAGKVDSDRIRTQIAFSDEALFLSAEDIVLFGNVTIGNIIKEQNGTTSGNIDPSITRIVGDRIQTGTILSNNWSATDGTSINLDTGQILVGGSTNPNLSFDGAGNLTISGTLTADSIVESSSLTLSDITQAVEGLPADFFDEADLQSVLDAGVENIIAGLSADFQLEVDANSIIAKHKDADPAGLGSGYSGVLRTGLLINANGIAMGYNDPGTGAWTNAVSMDASGNGIFKGTVLADSIIAASATINGVTLGAIKGQAEEGDSHANDNGNPHGTQLSQVGGRLDDISDLGSAYKHSTANQNAGGGRAYNALDGNSKYILELSTQHITVSGTSPVNGIVIDGDGLRGYKGGGLPKFEIPTDGSAVVLKGDIETSGKVLATGQHTISYDGKTFITSIMGRPDLAGTIGVVGVSDNTWGVAGYSKTSYGVYGIANSGYGVVGATESSNAIGMLAVGFGTGAALEVQGKIVKSEVSSHRLKLYNASTGALVDEYRYEFT